MTDDERTAGYLQIAQAGGGIPDDIMMRLNVATARNLVVRLDAWLDAELVADGGVTADTLDESADWLLRVFDHFSNPEREMLVGGLVVTAAAVFGDRWRHYAQDGLYEGFEPIVQMAEALGVRRGLWALAEWGVRAGRRWFPSAQWGRAVTALRDDVAAGRETLPVRASGALSEEVARIWVPEGDDEEFWEVLRCRPNELRGPGAYYVKRSTLRDRLEDVRREDRERLATTA